MVLPPEEDRATQECDLSASRGPRGVIPCGITPLSYMDYINASTVS